MVAFIPQIFIEPYCASGTVPRAKGREQNTVLTLNTPLFLQPDILQPDIRLSLILSYYIRGYRDHLVCVSFHARVSIAIG